MLFHLYSKISTVNYLAKINFIFCASTSLSMTVTLSGVEEQIILSRYLHLRRPQLCMNMIIRHLSY